MWGLGLMPVVTSSLKDRAKLVLSKTEKFLVPADSPEIAGHITLLLAHYFRDANVPQSVADGLSLQWLKCLEEFPEWAIERAVTEYLKDDLKGRRPTPGQIVAIARKEVSRLNALAYRCKQVLAAKEEPGERKPPTEEEKAAVSKILAEAKIGLTMPGNYETRGK